MHSELVFFLCVRLQQLWKVGCPFLLTTLSHVICFRQVGVIYVFVVVDTFFVVVNICCC